jgi:hypothetical protein
MCSLTPLLGMSPLRKRFKARNGAECAEVLMTIDDCAVSRRGHIPDEDIPGIIASYDENERATRVYGADLQGEGAVFRTQVEQIKHTLDAASVPRHWPWLWGMDFRHSGSATSGHPFAAVLLTWDRDADVVYVMHAVRMLGLAPNHVVAMKAHPMFDAPAAYPHDGGRGGSLISGETVKEIYKRLGVSTRPTHATFSTGGYSFEDGITEMELRLGTGRLKIAAHLTEWFDEYRGYHRKDGLVVKLDDDLLSATRVAIMDLRFARTPEKWPANLRRSNAAAIVASGTDFDVFAPS